MVWEASVGAPDVESAKSTRCCQEIFCICAKLVRDQRSEIFCICSKLVRDQRSGVRFTPLPSVPGLPCRFCRLPQIRV